MAWAKLHTDILGDPKLMRAARKGARELVYLPWLIAFAKQADDGGCLSVGGEPAEPEDIAALIPGAEPEDITEALASLLAIGVLLEDGDRLCFAKWESRSGARDSDSPSAVYERVKKHRQKQRESRAERNAAPTQDDNGNDNALQKPLRVTNDNAREEKRRRGEGEKNREETTAARARGAPPTPAWVAPIRDRWISRIGDVAPTTIARHLTAAHRLHGDAPLLRAVDAYADAKLAVGKPCKLEWFAGEVSVWVTRAAAAAQPLVDADGILTERGVAVLNGAHQ